MVTKISKIFFACVFILLLLPTTAKATEVFGGTINLKIGESDYECVEPTGDIVTTGTWSTTGTGFAITSRSNRSCTIRAYSVGTGTLRWSGYIGAYRIDWYWNVKVTDPNPDPDPNSDTTPEPPEEPTEKWSDGGNYSISWYNKNQDEFTISTNKELAGMAYLINNGYTEFEGKTIKLSNDIDLSGKKWTQCENFKGVFDGQGHTIFGVYIGNDEYQQTLFGFWKSITKATINSITLQGVVNVKYEKDYTYLGGLVGCAYQSIIQDCVVDMDLFCDKEEKTSYSGEDAYIGGVCGGGTSGISNSIFIGSFTCNASTSKLFLGGIAGKSGSIKFCESFIYKLFAKTKGKLGVRWSVCGIGESDSDIKCCRSIINDIDIACGFTYTGIAEDEYYIGGISRSSATNCYSIIEKAVCTSNYKLKFFFGGISSGKAVNACFSNSDVKVDVKGNNTVLNRMYDGTTFTSEQMKTSVFLEELNMYSTLEMDGPVWKQNAGDYPYINNFWNNAPIQNEDKCATPTISYLNGKLTFECETEGVEFKSQITDTDIREYTSSTIDLSAAYHISVYAAKEGYEDSDVATATLCWIDMEPYADGTKEAEDAVTEVKAMPILIQTNGNNITIRGVAEGMKIDVYGLDGVKHGSAVSGKDRTKIPTNLLPGSTAIVKFGDKAVKVIVK